MSRGFQRQFISIFLLPGLATIAIAAIILWQAGSLNPGCGLATPWDVLPILVGLLLLLAGLGLMSHTIALFISTGKGTLAPWDPPQALVVRSPYRYVRNPMISGVLTVMLAKFVTRTGLDGCVLGN